MAQLTLSVNGSDVTDRLVSINNQPYLSINQEQESTTADIDLDYSDGATLPPAGSTFVVTLPGGQTIVLRAQTVSEVTEVYDDPNTFGFWIHRFHVVDPITYAQDAKLPTRKPFINTTTAAVLQYLFSSIDPTLTLSLAAGNNIAAFDLKDFTTLGDILKSEIMSGGYVLRMQNGYNIRGDFDSNFTSNSDWKIDQTDYRYTPSRFKITPTNLLIDDITVTPTKPVPLSRTSEFIEFDPRVMSALPLQNNVFDLEEAEILKISAGQDTSDTKLWQVTGSVDMSGDRIGLNGSIVMLDARPFVSPYKVAWTGVIPDGGTTYQFGFQDDTGAYIWSVSNSDYPVTQDTVDDQYTYEFYTNPTGTNSFQVWGFELHQNFTVDIDEILGHVSSVDYCTNTIVLDTAWTVDNNYIRILKGSANPDCIDVGDELGRAKIISRSGATLVVDILPKGIAAGCPVTRGVDADSKETRTLIKTVTVTDNQKYGLPAMSGTGIHVRAMVIQKSGMIDGYLVSESSPGLNQTYPRALQIDVDLTEFGDGVVAGSGNTATFTLAQKFSNESCAGIVLNYINGGKRDFYSNCGSSGGHSTVTIDNEQDPIKLQLIADRICELGSRNLPRVSSNMESTEIVGNPLPWDPLPLNLDSKYRVTASSVPIISSQITYKGSRTGAESLDDDVLLYEIDAGDKSAIERAQRESLRGQPVTKYPLRIAPIGGVRLTDVNWDGVTLTATIAGGGTVYGPRGQVLNLGAGIDPAREAGIADPNSNPVRLHCTVDGGNYHRDSIIFTVIYPPSYVRPESITCRYSPKRNIVTFNWPRSRGAVTYEVQRMFSSTGMPTDICLSQDLVSTSGCASGAIESIIETSPSSILYWQTVDYIDGRARGTYELPYEPKSKGIRFRAIGLCDKKTDWTEACCTLPKLPKPDPFNILKVFEGGTIVLHVGPPPTGCDEGRAQKLRLFCRSIGPSAEVDLYDASGNPDETKMLAFFSASGDCSSPTGCYDKLKIQDFPVTEETKEQDYRFIYQEYDPGENIIVGGAWVDRFNDLGHLALATTFAMGPPGCVRDLQIHWKQHSGYKSKWKIPLDTGTPFQGENSDTIYQYEVVYWIIEGTPRLNPSGGYVCPSSPTAATNYMGADDGKDYGGGPSGLALAEVFVEKQYHHTQHLDKTEIDQKFHKSTNNVHVCVRGWNIVNGIRTAGPWACTERGANVANPLESTSFLDWAFAGEDAVALDGYLYTGNLIQNRIEIVDYGNHLPNEAPVEVGMFDLKCGQIVGGGFQKNRVAVDPASTVLYTTGVLQGSCAGPVGIIGFDITDKTNPTLIGSVIGNVGATDLYAADGFLWAYNPDGSITKYSLASPRSPVQVESGSIASGKDKVSMMLAQGLFLVSDGGDFTIFDDTMTKLSTTSMGYGPTAGSFAYRQVSTVSSSGAVTIRRFVYIPDEAGDVIHIWEITDPTLPVELTPRQSFSTVNAPNSVFITGDFLWVTGSDTMDEFDIAVFDDPIHLANFDLPTIENHDYSVISNDGVLAVHGSSSGSPAFFFYDLATAIAQAGGDGDKGSFGSIDVEGDLTAGGSITTGGGITAGGSITAGGDITAGGVVTAGKGFATPGLRITAATSGTTSEIRFYELQANGDNYVGFKAPDALSTNTIWTLPSGDGSANQVVITDGFKHLTFSSVQNLIGSQYASINVIMDGGGVVLTTGIKVDFIVDFNCTIQSATLLADQTGDLVVDIWKDTYSNYPPTNADSITASAKPTLSSAIKSQDTTLTGWTKTINAGDTFRVNIDSVATIQRATLVLKVLKT